MDVRRPPASFAILLRALDPIEGGYEMQIAHDLLAVHGGLDRAAFAEAGAFVDALVADPSVTNADLKGLLNRLAGPVWGMEFDFGADAKAARRYFEALSRAIAQELT